MERKHPQGVPATKVLDAGLEHPDWYKSVRITSMAIDERGFSRFVGTLSTGKSSESWRSAPASSTEIVRFNQIRKIQNPQ